MIFIPLSIFIKLNGKTMIDKKLINIQKIKETTNIQAKQFEISSSLYRYLKSKSLNVSFHSNKYFVTTYLIALTYFSGDIENLFISNQEEASYLLSQINWSLSCFSL